MNIEADAADLCPSFTKFEAVIRAMSFSDRSWLLKAMHAFSAAMEETRLARRAHDKRIVRVFESGSISEQAYILVNAVDLQSREAVLTEFARSYLDIRRQSRKFRSGERKARLGISPRAGKTTEKRKRV
jgi:hypothetical protein